MDDSGLSGLNRPRRTLEHDSHTWSSSQCFGGNHVVEDLLDGDVVTAVEFDEHGDYLAVGDKAGRIWIYESAAAEKNKSPEYKFYGQFQSHEPEFDYLKSLEIEEKINMIKWCRRQNESLILLAANDKTIKLWKIYERKIKKVSHVNVGESDGEEALDDVHIPEMTYFDTVTAATPRRIYANAHAYHINSISINSDGETYISADDLRINLWNLDIANQSFNIVDIKPVNMEELTEVITAAQFHPQHCNLLLYSTSRGSIKLSDLRDSALCDQHAKLFEVEEDPADKSFFSEIIASISDVNFTPDGRYIISRDYLTVKVWDVNMEREPVCTIPIHDMLQEKLCDLYENDCIFDKFECAPSPRGDSFLTGSYNESFVVCNWQKERASMIPCEKPLAPLNSNPSRFASNPSQLRVNTVRSTLHGGPSVPSVSDVDAERMANGDLVRPSGPASSVEDVDFGKKVLHCAWHPEQDLVAVACLNNMFMYRAQPQSEDETDRERESVHNEDDP